MANNGSLLERLIAIGEDRLEQAMEDVVNSPLLAGVMEQLVEAAQQSREWFDASVKQVASRVNVPSSEVVGDIADRIELVETRLGEMLARVEALTAKSAPAPAAKKSAAKKKSTKKKAKKKTAKKKTAKKKATQKTTKKP